MDLKALSSAPTSPAIAEPAGAAARAASVAKSSAVAVQTQEAVGQSAAAPSPEQTRQAVQKINTTIQSLSQGVTFSIDEDSNSTVIKVIDQQTKEVLRQMPSKEALEIARALDRVQGLLIKQKA